MLPACVEFLPLSMAVPYQEILIRKWAEYSKKIKRDNKQLKWVSLVQNGAHFLWRLTEGKPWSYDQETFAGLLLLSRVLQSFYGLFVSHSTVVDCIFTAPLVTSYWQILTIFVSAEYTTVAHLVWAGLPWRTQCVHTFIINASWYIKVCRTPWTNPSL